MNINVKEIEKLTIDLVNIPSINNSVGEAKVADKVYEYFTEINYFKENPNNLWTTDLINDRYGRKNIFALLMGEKDPKNKKTIIIHGHIDTVGIEDFGEVSRFAFDPIVLKEKLKELDLPDEIQKDVESDDWLFGRGACDMKSGVAVHMYVVKKLAENIKEFSGNIIFMANPVEENQHTGIMEALSDLKNIKEKNNLKYIMAINNDYITDMYPGDTNKYIYTGAVGKLLPCFYVSGKETHVGQCFEGLNPNIISAELIRLIDLNIELCDEYNGEFTLPPSSLRMTDLKDFYNVQIPFASYLYFNYSIHNKSTVEIMDELKEKAETAMKNSLRYVDKQFKLYCDRSENAYTPIKWNYNILSYEELYEKVKEQYGDELDQTIRDISLKMLEDNEDTRVICLKIVEKLKQLNKDKNPSIIIFFSPPYCPHNTLKKNIPTEAALINKLENIIDDFSKESDYKFKIQNFFPSLSDSSYLKIDDDHESVNKLVNNFPDWEKIYKVPLGEIKEFNVPAVNYGVYGKDAHKWTERVYKPYSFETLPKLLFKTIEELCK